MIKTLRTGYIDIEWRENNYNGCWPKPYQESRLNNDELKALVIGLSLAN